MKKTKIIIPSVLFLIVLILIYLNFRALQKSYIQLFKLTTLISYKDKNDGTIEKNFYYLNGQIKAKNTTINGKKSGLEEWFYSDGKVESKKQFVNNLANGTDTGFYSTGKIRYTSYWVQNRNYGGQYYYYENGTIEAYHCYDIKGEKFFLIRNDSSGKILKQQGIPFSLNVFSKNYSNSNVILKNNLHYEKIKDLFITVATPRNLNIAFFVLINNKKIDDLTIKDNTIKIPNVFNSMGTYHLSIGGRLIDKNQEVVSTQISELSIIVDNNLP